MDNENRIKQLINSVGAVAELIKLFYQNLVKVGFNDRQAIFLTAKFLETLFANDK